MTERAHSGFLGELEPEELRELTAAARRQTFARGALLLAERQLGERVMALLAGRVKLTRATSRGRDVVLGFRSPGDLLGELAAIDGRPRSGAVVALEPVETLTLATPDFLDFLTRRPRVSLVVILCGRVCPSGATWPPRSRCD